jgi:hypothetical protein
MATHDIDRLPLEEPLAELERQLISAYVTGAGQDLDALLARDDAEAKRILAKASLYASSKLSEVESRNLYLHKLHGES